MTETTGYPRAEADAKIRIFSREEILLVTGVLADFVLANPGGTIVSGMNQLGHQLSLVVSGVKPLGVFLSANDRDTQYPNPAPGALSVIRRTGDDGDLFEL